MAVSRQCFIQFLFADVEEGGINGPELKATVESHLRTGGVEVFDGQLLRPKLYIKIGALKVERISHYVYSVEMDVREHAILSRNSQLNSFAMSWTTQAALGIVPASSMAPSIQEVVIEMVDRFITDFTTANRVATGG